MAFQQHDGGSSWFAQFMGFRPCPNCGETLFAAEAAEFVIGSEVRLRWRCDACDHAFASSQAMAEAA
jgi:ribosomal protein S27AE